MASENVAGKIFRPALTVIKVIAGYRDPMRKTGGENRSRPSRTAAFVIRSETLTLRLCLSSCANSFQA